MFRSVYWWSSYGSPKYRCRIIVRTQHVFGNHPNLLGDFQVGALKRDLGIVGRFVWVLSVANRLGNQLQTLLYHASYRQTHGQYSHIKGQT